MQEEEWKRVEEGNEEEGKMVEEGKEEDGIKIFLLKMKMSSLPTSETEADATSRRINA